MNRIAYRLEPLVRVSEIARRVARRRVAAASRDVCRRRREVRTVAERVASASVHARCASDSDGSDTLAIRSTTSSRVEDLLAVARSARDDMARARRWVQTAARVRDRRVDEARLAERDARCQRSAREAVLEKVRERTHRQAERTETEDAAATWLATRRDVDLEPYDAN